MSQKIASVLHVEDDTVDARILQHIFSDHRILNPLRHASDGVEALEILRGENGRERLEKPYVILLDMKMPRMGGIEFLGELRADPQLQDTLVFMLSTFMGDEARAVALRHSVAGIVLKDEIARDGSQLIEMLDECWHVPPGASSPSKLLKVAGDDLHQ